VGDSFAPAGEVEKMVVLGLAELSAGTTAPRTASDARTDRRVHAHVDVDADARVLVPATLGRRR
jgi:hypothetical protein